MEHLLLVNIRLTVLGPDDAFGRFPEVAAQADARIAAHLGLAKRALLLKRVACAHRASPFTGIFVSREDSVEAAADIAAHLGVAWNSQAAVQRMQNKWLTRQTLSKAGLRQPAYRLCASEDDLLRLLDSQAGAWIVKPLVGTGSRGISRATTAHDVAPAVAHVRTVQPTGSFLVEGSLEPAREYSVEGVWVGGRPHVLAVTAKETTGPPRFVELGHTLPVTLGDELDAEVRTTVMRGLALLGAAHGLFHVEVFVDRDGVVFGEAHRRAGGDRITQLLQLAGVDLHGLALDGSYRPVPASMAELERVAAVRYFRFPPGTLRHLAGVDALAQEPDVVFCQVDVHPGESHRSRCCTPSAATAALSSPAPLTRRQLRAPIGCAIWSR